MREGEKKKNKSLELDGQSASATSALALRGPVELQLRFHQIGRVTPSAFDWTSNCETRLPWWPVLCGTLFVQADDGLDALELDGFAARQRVAWRTSRHKRDAGPDRGTGLQRFGLPHRGQAELLLPHRESLLASLSSLLKSQFV